MRYRDIQEATATRKLIHGTDRGRMNEIILATAIFSKFILGEKDVTAPYLTKALLLLAKSPTGLRNKKNPDNDPIRLSIQDRGDTIVKDIQDIASNIPSLKDEIEGNVDAANSDATADKLSKVYAENGKPDEVLVSQLGSARSKTDVLLQYVNQDGTYKTLRPYSAKTFSDRLDNKDLNSIEALNDYFNNFAIKLNAQGIIDRSDNADEVFLNAFKDDEGQMNTLLAGDVEKNEKKFIKQVYNFIINMGSKGDPDLLLIDNRKGKASVYDFQLLMQNVDKVDLAVSSGIVGEKPSLFVYDKKLGQGPGNLLQLRYTYSAPGTSTKTGQAKSGRHRILVDGGALFKNLTLIVKKNKEINNGNNQV